ncbi:MAG: ribonuclease R family protein [Terriglobia bacterium]
MRPFPSRHQILEVFEAHPEKTFRLRELVEQLGLASSQARELKSVLKELAKRRAILYLKKSHFALGSRRDQAPRREKGSEPAPHRPAATQPNVVTGRLIGHRDGYGFVVPDARAGSGGQDVFIPPPAMKDAMHGDRVEVQVFASKLDPRRPGARRLEGVILRVLRRQQRTVVGEFHHAAGQSYVQPFDTHVAHRIVIPRGEERPHGGDPGMRHRQFGGESEAPGGRKRRAGPSDLEGLIVDVEITDFPSRLSPPRGRVIEVLGERDDFGVDVEIMIRKFHLPHRFPREVLDEAARARREVTAEEREGRADFRHLPVVTIDGETAKDFDDAVYVERRPNNRYLLQVHIADVAHYVRPGAAIDREAQVRGTSVYFPDRAVPMLPLELSNGICSLNPDVARLVMSLLMEIDGNGHTVATEIVPGVIRSHERMTYTAVHAILSEDESACRRYAPLVEEFELMEELAIVLNERREARGSIDFDLPEPSIEFDERGQMTGIARSERNIAHRIIEEFMLAANEAVAVYLEHRAIPSLFRIHEKPDPKKIVDFEQIAATFGYSLGVELPAAQRVRVRGRDDRQRSARYEERPSEDLKITSRHYQRLTKRIAGKPEERILSYLMLRSLKQARYSEENQGHFALASATYTHFTSPIRRYPDLIVHRILNAALQDAGSHKDSHPARVRGMPPGLVRASKREPEAGLDGGVFITAEELHALGIETSECERRAADAERELMDWKKVTFMSSRMGEEFEALIISLGPYGFFVELIDLFVEGLVPVESFGDPGWTYRETLRALVHRDSRRAYRLGDRVTVRLDRIDRDGNKLLFSVVEA